MKNSKRFIQDESVLEEEQEDDIPLAWISKANESDKIMFEDQWERIKS